jgi:hypothetical protein
LRTCMVWQKAHADQDSKIWIDKGTEEEDEHKKTVDLVKGGNDLTQKLIINHFLLIADF